MLARAAAGRARCSCRATATWPAGWPSGASAARCTCSTTGSSTSRWSGTSTSCSWRQDELERPVTLPRRPAARAARRAAAAHALILDVPDAAMPRSAGHGAAGRACRAVFRLRRALGRPRLVEPATRRRAPAAGHARAGGGRHGAAASGFFSALAVEGWTVAGRAGVSRSPPVHRRGRRRASLGTMRDARAVMVVTTEKDLVRLLPLQPLPLPVAWVPLRVVIEPAARVPAPGCSRESLGRGQS